MNKMLTKAEKIYIIEWLRSGPLYDSPNCKNRNLMGDGVETLIDLNGYQVEYSAWRANMQKHRVTKGDVEGLLGSMGWVVSRCPACLKNAGIKKADNGLSPKCEDCKGGPGHTDNFIYF